MRNTRARTHLAVVIDNGPTTMRLLDAHQVISDARLASGPVRRYALATGFTPLALETFFRAHMQRRHTAGRVDVEVGRFGDLVGNIERGAAADMKGVAIAIEWSDLDPRFSWRSSAAVGETFHGEVVGLARAAAHRLVRAVEAAAARQAVAVSLPTLPLPPFFSSVTGTAAASALGVRMVAAALGVELATIPGVRVIDPQRIDASSEPGLRADLTADLLHGFPYARAHASALGRLLAEALEPAPTKKGLITDLDGTLWRGVLGEVGVEGVTWGFDSGAQVHAIYQRCLAALAESGVLVAVASKNDAAVVAEPLLREDLLLPPAALFPVHAGWAAKSTSVAAILDAWNVGADSVVFVDDSALEIAEVQSRFPEVEGVLFDGHDPANVSRVVGRLRALFGQRTIADEDRLRAASVRQGAALRAASAAAHDSEAFAAQLGARVAFGVSRDASDTRALELLNKTNQFNLNGRRYTISEWREALARPSSFLMTVAYEDRYGPLGKIGVVLGDASAAEVRVRSWVLSCRAFARRIEDLILRMMFEAFSVGTVVLDVEITPRNGPAQELLRRYGSLPSPGGSMYVTREAFERAVPALYQHATLRVATDRLASVRPSGALDG